MQQSHAEHQESIRDLRTARLQASNNVIMIYDSDGAGTSATLRGIDILSSKGLRVGVVLLEGAKDPDDFFSALLYCAKEGLIGAPKK